MVTCNNLRVRASSPLLQPKKLSSDRRSAASLGTGDPAAPKKVAMYLCYKAYAKRVAGSAVRREGSVSEARGNSAHCVSVHFVERGIPPRMYSRKVLGGRGINNVRAASRRFANHGHSDELQPQPDNEWASGAAEAKTPSLLFSFSPPPRHGR